LHHEIELVVAVGVGGHNISPEQAAQHVFGFAVGLDLTRRDLQEQAKSARRPWDTSKGFDYSAPISQLHPVEEFGNSNRWLESGRIWLDVNGQRRQDGNLDDMIWSVGEVLAELSTYFELLPGDLVFTGTPSGVGELKPGDHIKGGIDGLDTLEVKIQ
jgi:fumarylpyruvate hydrolase